MTNVQGFSGGATGDLGVLLESWTEWPWFSTLIWTKAFLPRGVAPPWLSTLGIEMDTLFMEFTLVPSSLSSEKTPTSRPSALTQSLTERYEIRCASIAFIASLGRVVEVVCVVGC